MKISENWLREFVSTNLSAEEIAEELTMLGLEVDSVKPISRYELCGVVWGKVVEATPLKQESNLKVCSIDLGKGSTKTVVCGAECVPRGLLVAYAASGTNIVGEKLDKKQFDGVVSDGMLCSREDLGLEEHSEELLTIRESDAKKGDSISEALGLPDFVFDLDLTPNRGDCFSVLGVARELSCLEGNALHRNENEPVSPDNNDAFPIEIESSDRCPQYSGRVIRNVRTKAKTPTYIRERLLRSDVRPINAVVDITNYVMLEMGQPMHAFDFSQLTEGIIVRVGKHGESIKLLDGKSIDLSPDVLVVADHCKPVALAGIMGGELSAVTEQTRDIFLESAFFEPTSLAGAARSFGLQTDASTRFERGVDPALHLSALERATALISEVCGGEVGLVCSSMSDREIKPEKSVEFRPNSVNKKLGTNLSLSSILKTLELLSFDVTQKSEMLWQVRVPSFRFDISSEVDLVEEIGRLSGYDKIPSELPKLSSIPRPYPADQEMREGIRRALVWRSFCEVITYSFISREMAQSFTDSGLVQLTNPISSEMAFMRPSIISSLINPLRYNINRQKDQIKLFELGKVFKKKGEKITEELHLAAVSFGHAFRKQWDLDPKEVDFFDIKADLVSVLGSICNLKLDIIKEKKLGLHPGQSAIIYTGDTEIGIIGAIHPEVLDRMAISGSVLFFEVNLDLLRLDGAKEYSPISRFPIVTRDISVVVDKSISAKLCLSAVEKLDLPNLKDLQLFDLYTGQGIDSEKKSFSISLIFQSSSSTLTDVEVDNDMNVILKNLEEEVGALLRD